MKEYVMFDFYKYIEAFNSGDDKMMVENFWTDDMVVVSNGGELARGKKDWLKKLEELHDGIRELIRVQVLMQNEDNIFAEIDMDFHATKDRLDYGLAPLEKGDFITVKMFPLYYIRGDKIVVLKLAMWPPNVGVSDPPARVFGPPPPIVGKNRKVF
jgi:hypothetical protein